MQNLFRVSYMDASEIFQKLIIFEDQFKGQRLVLFVCFGDDIDCIGASHTLQSHARSWQI